MGSNICQVVASIDAIAAVDDDEQLKSLDRAITEYFAYFDAALHVQVWFRLFERFLEDDAYGMFWSILHEIEKLPNYEEELVASVHCCPSQFTVRMVNRRLNAGLRFVGEVDLMSLLESVAVDETCPASVREDAKGYIEHQRGLSPRKIND